MATLRIVSYNVNGIRAAMKKGLVEWLKTDPADIICIQETKAEKDNVAHNEITSLGFQDFWFSAKKKGYSGAAVFTKIKPDQVQYGTGHSVSDDEGRVIQLDFGDIRLINAYFPSGTSGEIRQGYKYQWLDEFYLYLDELKKKYPRLILCGDYNIAHREIDIHDPKGNKNSSGFLPAERAWMDKFFSHGYVDTFREFNKKPEQYTWWSYRTKARERNVGWRLDYFFVNEEFMDRVENSYILYDVMGSDHCPVGIDIKIKD